MARGIWTKLTISAILARWPLGDIAISLTGLGLAAGAALFAVVMIGESARGGRMQQSEHFAIFARPITLPYTGAKGTAPLYDPMPVGTVRARPVEAQQPKPPTEPIAQGYRMRGYSQGSALVQGPAGFITVRPGSTIEGLGDVVSIEARGRRVVVVTTAGLIVDD